MQEMESDGNKEKQLINFTNNSTQSIHQSIQTSSQQNAQFQPFSNLGPNADKNILLKNVPIHGVNKSIQLNFDQPSNTINQQSFPQNSNPPDITEQPFQPQNSEITSDSKNDLLIYKVYFSRKEPAKDTEFLCSLTNTSHKQFAKWIDTSKITTFPNFIREINTFNTKQDESEFLSTISKPIQNTSLSKIEVIAKIENNYLFRYSYNDFNLFAFDSPINQNLSALITNFNERMPTPKELPIEPTNGFKFLYNVFSSEKSCLFMGDYFDVFDCIAAFNGRIIIVSLPTEIEKWSFSLQERNVIHTCYFGDDFCRSVKRQYQIPNSMVIITDYYTLYQDYLFFLDEQFDVVVADKSDAIKSANSKKYNLIYSLHSNQKVFLANDISISSFNVLQPLIEKPNLVFELTIPKTKHIFLNLSDEQLILYQKCTNDKMKIINHPLLVEGIEKLFQSIPRSQLFILLSTKFLYLYKLIKQITTKIYIHSSSKKLLILFEEFCKLNYISTKYYHETFEGNVILTNEIPKENDFVFSFDTEIPNCYRLISYGTIEHRILSEQICSRNIYNKPIFSVDPPKQLNINDNEFNYTDFIIEEEFFDYKSFNGITNEEETIFDITNNTLKSLKLNGYNNQSSLETCLLISLFRAINPLNISSYPLLLYKLLSISQNYNLQILLCSDKSQWLKPLKNYFSIDFSGIKSLKKHIFNSAEKILKKIETNLIITNFKLIFNETILQQICINSEVDIKILESLMNFTHPMIYDQQRIERIIFEMKSQLILNNFENSYKIPFWTKYEIKQLLKTISDFGFSLIKYLPNVFHSKTGLMSKTTDEVYYFSTKLISMINSATQITISLQLNIPKEYVSCGISNTYEIESDQIIELQIHNNLISKIFQISEILKLQNHNEKINDDLTNIECLSLFNYINQFGITTRKNFLLKLFQTKQNISNEFLTGKFQLYFDSDIRKFPFYILNDYQFQIFLNDINIEQQNRKENKNNQQEYKPSNELLQRVAQLERIMHQKIQQKRNISRKKNFKTDNKLQQQEQKPQQQYTQIPVWNNIVFPAKSIDTQQQTQQQQQQQQNKIVPLTIPNNITPIKKRRFNTNQQQNKNQLNKQAQIRASQEAARKMTDEFLRTLPHRAEPPKQEVQQQNVLTTPVFSSNVTQNQQNSTKNNENITNQNNETVIKSEVNFGVKSIKSNLPPDIPLPLKKKLYG